MALSDIKTYFRAQIAEVDSAMREWTDGFNVENIPSTIYDKSYHLSFGTISGQVQSGKTQEIEVEFILRAFFKGHRNVGENVDRAVDLMQSVIENVGDPTARLGSSIKNVKFLSMTTEESFTSNDNLILVTQTYSVTKFLCSGS